MARRKACTVQRAPSIKHRASSADTSTIFFKKRPGQAANYSPNVKVPFSLPGLDRSMTACMHVSNRKCVWDEKLEVRVCARTAAETKVKDLVFPHFSLGLFCKSTHTRWAAMFRIEHSRETIIGRFRGVTVLIGARERSTLFSPQLYPNGKPDFGWRPFSGATPASICLSSSLLLSLLFIPTSTFDIDDTSNSSFSFV